MDAEPAVVEPRLDPDTELSDSSKEIELEAKVEETEATPQRPFTTLRWISVCVGLYLTAMLYGN